MTSDPNRFLVWGCVNPKGEDGEGYNGLFLTDSDINDCVRNNSLSGLPVKVEHCGVDVGKVVTSWDSGNGALQVLLEVDRRVLEGDIVSRFIGASICQDFSLGYTVGLKYSDSAKTFQSATKTYTEVSIVRRGARPSTHISGFTVLESVTKKRKA
jgi:hypothetical protein